MDGKHFLGTARFLRNSGIDEAAYRSAVSRAYYACFLETRQVAFDSCGRAERLRAQIKKAGNIGHEPLQRYLKNSEVVSVRQLGEDLAGLHGSRKDADYDMLVRLSADDAQDAIEAAQTFLNALSQVQPREVGRAMEQDIRRNFP